ncbi:hypothetical protein Scep_014482 [Stephania cephalantha]|uniref:Uncharacterized protein n=1 Tax=Stephania cephalantha TaxID=152367 RepID=A0AAP0P322_9MAGN
MAPFEIFSSCSSSESTVLNRCGVFEEDLVSPYHYLILAHSQVALSPQHHCSRASSKLRVYVVELSRLLAG